jgi:2-polyprenyl-6-methoxyphenol hydroxylase-like FAD-dependent oxidoreductase
MKKITIIGAGIGGLTTAISLIQKGFEVEIFENSPAFKKAGSGINLAINAMQIYRKLGVYDDILQKANYTNSMNALTKKLNVLTSANFQKFEKKYNAKTVAIHRATLHEILVSHIGNTKIHLNKKLTYLEQKNGIVSLTFEDGTNHNTEIVIGADGIHSNVRKSIFKNTELRDAKQVCWRGISNAKINKKHKEELNEIWGKGNRFGFIHITLDEIYWFALIDKKEFKSKGDDLMKIFSDYPQIVKDIITGTEKKDILCSEIWDLKPIDKWYKGHVCLLGDAGHATTPNMGQGAVQAIESAMALSICLKEEESIETAFLRYEIIRKEKANYIIKTSWLLGKIAQSNNSLICFLRNFILKITPKYITEKQSDKVFKLNY